MKKVEQALIDTLKKYGYSLYIGGEAGDRGRRSVRDFNTHNDVFYGTGSEREAFLRGMICVVRGDAMKSV